MTFRVRYKVYSVAEPDRENWTSIDEFRIAVDPNSNKSLSTAIQDATSIYKEGRAWSLEDNIPYLTDRDYDGGNLHHDFVGIYL